jgi:hypothetical protein
MTKIPEKPVGAPQGGDYDPKRRKTSEEEVLRVKEIRDSYMPEIVNPNEPEELKNLRSECDQLSKKQRTSQEEYRYQQLLDLIS